MPAWSDHMIHTNGVDLHYRQNGDHPSIILLHGMTDNGRCWQRAAEALAGEFDLIMPDARGHGLSSAPEHGYRAEDRVADTLGLMDAVGIEQAVIIGHSMGAETGALLAAQAPERVRAAVLEDPPFRLAPRPPGFAEESLRSAQEERNMPLADLIDRGRAQNPTWSEDTFVPWAEAKHQLRLQAFNYFTEPATDWRSYIADIHAPTLLLTGEPERGAIITPEVAAMISERAPSVRVVQVAGAGHCIRYEQFDAYMAAVRDFLREVL